MGKDYQEIDDRIRRFVERQHVFFVSTAPRSDEGLINCSPKGLDSLRIIGPRQIAYADLGGSGIETVAHLKENGRIVVMMCAFAGPPKIFRFYGQGRVLEPHEKEFSSLVGHFPELPAIRNLVVVDIARIRDSCGYGVPFHEYKGQRTSIANWRASKSDQDLLDYRVEKNELSLDGLPGLEVDKIN